MLLACTLAVGVARGQTTTWAPDTNTLVGRLHAGALEGAQRNLRDLATLTDRAVTDSAARDALDQLTAFTRAAPDLRAAPRQELLDFYYARADSLRFSPLLRAYYDEAVERQGTPYELVALDAYLQSDRSMHLRTYIAYAREALEYGSAEDLERLAEKISDLRLPEGHAYLLEWLDDGKAALLATEPAAYRHYLDQLLERPGPEVAEVLFESERRGYLTAATLAGYLSRLANVPFAARWSREQHAARYATLVDSLGGLDRVRGYGYTASVPFAPSHFREPVDFYGRVLAEPGLPTFVAHNALLDLIDSRHPRALFYLSALLWRARTDGAARPASYYVYLLRKLTGLGVQVPDGAGAMTYELDVTGDREAWLNFVRYWGGRYEDYDYDEHRGGFVNRHDRSLESENLERLFRHLNSDNDAVALRAYARLTQADPVEVRQLAAKYRGLLRSTHPKVPPLKDGHLEQLSELTAYCRRNRVEFEPAPRLAARLDSLLAPLPPQRRVALEDRLVAELSLADLTPLEYWGALHQYHLEAGFSVGRVLDYAYSAHWPAVLASDADLRLYLKKANVFARMDGIGVAEDYLRKFGNPDEATRERLRGLLRSEGDAHISRSLKRLLNAGDEAEEADAVATLDAFLAEPELLSREEAAALPDPTLEQLSELLWLLEDDPTPKAKARLRTYLESRTDDTRLVPDFMSLLMRGESVDEVARLLGSIYHFSFGRDEGDPVQLWLARWREHSATYPTWGEEFYHIHLDRLATAERVSAGDLNAILRSPYYEPPARKAVLEALPRLTSNRHLFALRFDPPLAWSERAVLSGLELTYKDLQDLDKLFPDVPPAELIDFVMTEAEAFDAEDRGRLFNALMRKPFVDELIDDPNFAAHADTIAAGLRWYLEHSELVSAYEEEMTALNLARLSFIGASPAERLRRSIALEIDPAAKLRIQEGILARVSYADLPEVLPLYTRLAEVDGKLPYNFLSRDFGLPIFELESATCVDTFLARHARLRPRELYAVYLDDFGVGVSEADGGLDYATVERILSHDIALPFLGGGGNRRDLYVYGVVKLLELTHENRLGFHEKLNRNQVFYGYSASKQAEAWLDYLRAEGLLPEPGSRRPPSFTTTTN